MADIALDWASPQGLQRHVLSARKKGLGGYSKLPLSRIPDAHPARSILDMLIENEGRDRFGRQVGEYDEAGGVMHVEPAFLAGLSHQDAAALQAPPLLPFAIDIRSIGAIMDPGFQVSCKFVSGGGVPQRVDVQGALARTGAGRYRLPLALLDLLTAADALASPIADEAKRIEAIGDLKRAIPDEIAETLNDGYLRDLRIFYAASTSLSLRPDGDSIQVEPVLFGRSAAEAAADGDLIDEEAHALLTPKEQEAFTGQAFRSRPFARSAYSLGGNTFVYVDPQLRPVLSLVRGVQASDPETRRRFAMSPRTFLRESLPELDETQLDGLFIETEQFSERVSGIDTWRKPVLPWIKPSPNTWLPEKFGVMLGEEAVELTVPLARLLVAQLENAVTTGAPAITFDVGGEIKEIPATAQAVATAREIAALADQVEASGRGEGPKGPALNLRRFLTVRDNLEDENFRQDISETSEPVDLSFAPPESLRSTLKPHQVEGLSWLMETLKRGMPGALLADDMGLGKTLQALCALAWRWEQGRAGKQQGKPSLIVAPTGLLNNWRDEIERHLAPGTFGGIEMAFGPHLKRLRQSANAGTDTSLGASTLDVSRWLEAGLVLTTFETLRDYHLSFARLRFALIVFDEAQKAKNPASQITRAAKTLNAELKIAMTGTPVENRLQDLWSITDVVWAGRLGSSRQFAIDYPDTDREKLKALNHEIRERGASRPSFMLRRLKRDSLSGLPAKTTQRYETAMPATQAEAYRRAVMMALAGRGGMSPGDGMLSTLHKLRRISLHPDLDGHANGDIEAWAQQSARTQALVKVLDRIHAAGEKALVFIEFLDAQDGVSALIARRYGFFAERINGATPGDKRQAIVRRFQDGPPGFAALILSPKAGGVGLTLTRANHAIHLTRWWNPAVEDQATDRVYRIGQDRDVTIHLPMAVHPDTSLRETSFDLKLNALLERKRTLSEDLLLAPDFGEADILELFNGVTTSAASVNVAQVRVPPAVEAPPPTGKVGSPAPREEPKTATTATRPVLTVKSPPAAVSAPGAASESLWRWAFAPGQSRSAASVLARLAGADIASIELQDPYCMVRDNRVHLATFLRDVIALAGNVARIEVRAWSPESWKIRKQSLTPESEGAAKFDFHQKLPEERRKGARLAWDLIVRKQVGDFHDRFIRFSVMEQGRSVTYQLDLSGGVDRFMDHSCETVATLARIA
jgi:superfamily II DNA or RNA helicase